MNTCMQVKSKPVYTEFAVSTEKRKKCEKYMHWYMK